MAKPQTIYIHADAPPKPALGQPCNGCGVCCLLEPCPLGVVLSRRRRGACVAVQWSDAEKRYQCGMVTSPRAYLPSWVARAGGPWLGRALARWARRMISAGVGCDAALETTPPTRPPGTST